MRLFLVVALAALSLPALVHAQEATGDWDLTQDPARDLVAASATFSSGLTVALRCMDGRYDALIIGLPEPAPRAEFRPISLQFGDEPAQEDDWFIAESRTMAISRLPARLARQLRDGGQVRVRVQEGGEGGRRLRYDLDLPPSPAQIDRTLQACDRPTVDPRDALVADLGDNGLPGGVRWARMPEPNYPDGRTFERGFVTVSCLNQPDGRLHDCLIESEYPLNGGFGEAALRATRRARVEIADAPDAPVPARMIVFRVNFAMESAADAAVRERTPTRIPRRTDP